jgi:hypothetical protein
MISIDEYQAQIIGEELVRTGKDLLKNQKREWRELVRDFALFEREFCYLVFIVGLYSLSVTNDGEIAGQELCAQWMFKYWKKAFGLRREPDGILAKAIDERKDDYRESLELLRKENAMIIPLSDSFAKRCGEESNVKLKLMLPIHTRGILHMDMTFLGKFLS